MLKKLWNTLLSPTSETEERRPALGREALRLFVRHFRIGRKILYFPESHHRSALHTIVMAYRVNDHYVYSNDALLVDEEGAPAGFRISAGETLGLEEVRRFQVLLPDTSEMEQKLDYLTRAELGPAGHLRQGNMITLVCDSAERCVPFVEAVVQRKQVMQDGPYDKSPTILVTPDLASLKVRDKRSRQRVATAIWADLYHAAGAPPFPCVLKDFSENSLRLQTGETPASMPRLDVGKLATVEFDFGSVDATYRLRGRIIRCDDTTCVLQLEQIDRDGDFERIRMIDVVEIKTRLLNPDSDPAKP